ncbi:hypothetical protein C5167_046155 [Papaver somniferum]|uniref:Uncharacterized protein n=1 Tax=Papaver somniferum TaxID=3469 RepID=A0A4Y7LGM5_PAPSO|nr:hypothetical protein C5167_046155 [Papaver somniferum]
MVLPEKQILPYFGTQLLSTTLGVREYVHREFLKFEQEVILPNKRLFPSITSDDFFWASGILGSRAFSRLPSQDLVLVPLADLMLLRQSSENLIKNFNAGRGWMN